MGHVGSDGNAGRVALSESIVRKCLDEAIAHAVDGDRRHCVALESRRDEAVWVEITWDVINAAYPYEVEPAELLRAQDIEMPSGVSLEQWKPNVYASFEHAALPTEPVAEFVEAYFERVLRIVPSEFTLKIKRSRVGGPFRVR
jgi:hypothetical protein